MELVSVIIPARDACRTLAACLDALALQGVPGPGFELLVVDDASADDTRRLASRPGVRVLENHGRGPAAARNLGARTARGKVLIFLDADTAPCPGWLDEMVSPLTDPCVAAVKGSYVSAQRRLMARFTQLEFEAKYARLERAARVDFVDTGTAAYSRAAFDAAGGFDERFGPQSVEDVDLAFRLAETGARFAFNPRARVYHQHAETLAAYLWKKARYGYFRAILYRRFPSKVLGDSYTPPMMGVQIVEAFLLALLGVLAVTLQSPRVGLTFTLLLASFGATTLPLVWRARTRDTGLALAVPLLIYARATAQGIGMLAGVSSIVGRAFAHYLTLSWRVSTPWKEHDVCPTRHQAEHR
jgi:GT2 family glycosyltransferase